MRTIRALSRPRLTIVFRSRSSNSRRWMPTRTFVPGEELYALRTSNVGNALMNQGDSPRDLLN